jgi:hypothetical protein
MKVNDEFGMERICLDKETRKRANASNAVANISASEIEGGVTIETLYALNVPVYGYVTQVTLHGILPGVTSNVDALGYKSIIRNKNGSIGVRYSAIDAEKKKTIKEACHISKSNWHCSINSQGTMIYQAVETKDECISLLREIPSLFSGSKNGAYDPIRGCYYAIVNLNSIKADNLNAFVTYLTGMTLSEVKLKLQEIKQQRDAERAEMDSKRASRRENLAIMIEKFKTWIEANGVVAVDTKQNGTYLSVGDKGVAPFTVCDGKFSRGSEFKSFNAKGLRSPRFKQLLEGRTVYVCNEAAILAMKDIKS